MAKKLSRREKIAIDSVNVDTMILPLISNNSVVVISEDGKSYTVLPSRVGVDTVKHVIFSGKLFKQLLSKRSNNNQ